MKKSTKRKIKKTLFYIRRELIRMAVVMGATLGVLCLAVMIMEAPDSRLLTELAIGFFFALWLIEKIYIKKGRCEK